MRNALALCLGALVFASCSQRSGSSLFEGTAAQDAVRKLSEKMKAPVRVLKIEINPESISIQVQDPTAPNHVDQFVYRDSMFGPTVSGPSAINPTLINPKLEENLFNLDQMNFGAIPTAAQEAVRRVALDGGGAVESITIQRQIRILPSPSSGEVEWMIAVRGPRESATAYTDAQGRHHHLDLSGTSRARTLDFTQDADMLASAISNIRAQFGAKAIYAKISVSRLNVSFTVRDPENPKETKSYGCDLSGIHTSLLSVMNFKVPRMPSDKPPEFFSIDGADWSRVPAMRKAALESIVVPNGNVLDLELSRPAPKLKEQPLRWRVQVVSGAMGESGFAEFDPKTGQLTGRELPPSQVQDVNFLDPAESLAVLAKIKDDFGPGKPFLEITVDDRGATAKATPPGHPDQIKTYTYNATQRAEPPWSGSPESPFDQNFESIDYFGADELQPFEPRLMELEKKTLDRLKIAEGKISRLTVFRRGDFYPDSQKLLLEIRCEGLRGRSGRIVYDASGAVVDVVGP